MTHKDSFKDEFFLSFADLGRIARKKGKFILLLGMLCSLLGIFYAARKPVTYEAKAYFREKNASQSQGSGLAALLGRGGDESNTEPIMVSRRVAEDVVRKLGLNVIITPLSEPNGILENLKKNLFLEKIDLQKKYYPPRNQAEKKSEDFLSLKELKLPFSCNLHHYQGDAFYRSLIIEPLLHSSQYKVWDEKEKCLGLYQLGQKVVLDDCTFTLEGENTIAQRFALTLLPVTTVAEDLKGSLDIARDKQHTKFLYITYKDQDPHKAALVVNQFISSYKQFLNEEHKKNVGEQLQYLQERQSQLVHDLDRLMYDNADQLKEHIISHGFEGLERKGGYLEKLADKFNSRLLEIACELSMLDTKEGIELSTDNSAAIQMLNEKRILVQDRELLQISLQEQKAGQEEDFEKNWALYRTELSDIRKEMRALEQLQKRLSDPKALAEFWEKLNDKNLIEKFGANPFQGNSDVTEWMFHLEKYLENKSRFLKMREKLINEKLSYKKSPEAIYKGIDLVAARKIQHSLIEKIQQQASTSATLALASKRLDDEKCDIASLSASLNADGLVAEHIKTAAEINYSLKDPYNNSPKDFERLKGRLDIVRAFLQLHVKEAAAMSKLQKKLMEHELLILKVNTLDLFNQKIAVYEEQLGNMQNAHKKKLQKEAELIHKELDRLNTRASKMPLHWLQQEKIEMLKKMNQGIHTELVKSIEAKNISQNIERLESTAIDDARVPLMPKRPRLLLWASLGLIAGILGSSFTLTAFEIKKGLVVTKENLALQGYKVFGTLKGNEEDIHALRRAVSFVKESPLMKRIYVLGAKAPDSFDLMAHLLTLQGEKVLLIEASWFDKELKEQKADLELYLLGHQNTKPVPEAMQGGYDRLTTGPYSAFASELMNARKFEELMASFERMYDRLIVFLPLAVQATGAPEAVSKADLLLLSANNLRFPDLTDYLSSSKPLGFFV